MKKTLSKLIELVKRLIRLDVVIDQLFVKVHGVSFGERQAVIRAAGEDAVATLVAMRHPEYGQTVAVLLNGQCVGYLSTVDGAAGWYFQHAGKVRVLSWAKCGMTRIGLRMILNATK